MASNRVKSNQLRQRVKVVAKAANFAGLRNNQSWQKMTIAGVLSDNSWRGVPAIVSYCQINSPMVTFGQLFGNKKNCAAAISVMKEPETIGLLSGRNLTLPPILVGQSCGFALTSALASEATPAPRRQKHRFACFCEIRAARQRRPTLGAVSSCAPRWPEAPNLTVPASVRQSFGLGSLT